MEREKNARRRKNAKKKKHAQRIYALVVLISGLAIIIMTVLSRAVLLLRSAFLLRMNIR